MSFFDRLRAFIIYLKITPSGNDVQWLEGDAEALKSYLRSDSGVKLTAYMRSYILRQQDRAITDFTNLKFNAGACAGSKAILAQIDTLAEPKNFTADEAATPELD